MRATLLLHTQQENVLANRSHFVEHLLGSGHVVMNTMFEKPGQERVTLNWGKQHKGAALERNTYETLDYITVNRRWKNLIKDVRSDVTANVTSDHYPLTARVRIRLKARAQRQRTERKQVRERAGSLQR